jgi:hypothetical protein
MPKTKINILERTRRFDAANLRCARDIMAAQGRYGGDGSLMVEWARTIIQRDRENKKEDSLYAHALWEV